MTTNQTTRARTPADDAAHAEYGHPLPGYTLHDHVTEWQECDTCGLRLGAGITTQYDTAYYSEDHDPSDCPRCDGLMCLPVMARAGGLDPDDEDTAGDIATALDAAVSCGADGQVDTARALGFSRGGYTYQTTTAEIPERGAVDSYASTVEEAYDLAERYGIAIDAADVAWLSGR